ncbi:MAG: hypothetical protein PHY08_12630, partial [Candidatus Cloacimonetes bacterium]|nr:hypothetical protein [Candidatus Cloacimonadota bacterium]
MSINHKSIFLKVKEYNGNPIDEYNKISSFLNKKCYYNYSIYSLLNDNFQCSTLLRINYIDFDNCLNSVIKNLDVYADSDFSYLEEGTQEILLDDFLTYCELITHIYFVTYNNYIKRIWDDTHFDKNIYIQLIDLIKASLKSMNHDIKMIDDDTSEVLAIKCNPEAESVAEQSPTSLKEAIIYYLGSRDNDLEEKENRLHKIIDLLEPILKKYKELDAVKKVEEYVQLIRHSELKKNEENYKWFFENKGDYIDDIFMMCIFVKEYEITKTNIKKFESLKKE